VEVEDGVAGWLRDGAGDGDGAVGAGVGVDLGGAALGVAIGSIGRIGDGAGRGGAIGAGDEATRSFFSFSASSAVSAGTPMSTSISTSVPLSTAIFFAGL